MEIVIRALNWALFIQSLINQSFKNTPNLPIYIQYLDGNGNLRYIQSSNNTGSIPNFNNTTDLSSPQTNPLISKNKLVDENNLAIYTSSIVITIGNDNASRIDSYQDNCGIGYISNWGFWGSTRDMLSQADFEQLAPTLNSQVFNLVQPVNNNSFNQSNNSDSYMFNYSNDYLTYGLALTYSTNIIASTTNNISTSPCSINQLFTDGAFKLLITYNNGLYPGNNFKINQSYIIRNDPLVLSNPTSTTYIQFPQPFIAKDITITIPRVNIMDGSSRILKLNII